MMITSMSLARVGLVVLCGVTMLWSLCALYTAAIPDSTCGLNSTMDGKQKQHLKEVERTIMAQRIAEQVGVRIHEQEEQLKKAVEKAIAKQQDKLKDTVRDQEKQTGQTLSKNYDDFLKYLEQKTEEGRDKNKSRQERENLDKLLSQEYKRRGGNQTKPIEEIKLSAENKGKTPSKVVLITGCDKNAREKNSTRFTEINRNRREYATRHGYQYRFINTDGLGPKGADVTWEKLGAMRKAFRENPQADWFWWTDDDVLIMNQEFDLASQLLNPVTLEKRVTWGWPVRDVQSLFSRHLPNKTDVGEMENIHIVVTQDDTGWATSSILLKRSDWTEGFLDMWDDPVWRQQEFAYAEQSALVHIAFQHATVMNKIGTVPQRMINSYYNKDPHKGYQPGDFVIRFPGLAMKDEKFSPTFSRFVDKSRSKKK